MLCVGVFYLIINLFFLTNNVKTPFLDKTLHFYNITFISQKFVPIYVTNIPKTKT